MLPLQILFAFAYFLQILELLKSKSDSLKLKTQNLPNLPHITF